MEVQFFTLGQSYLGSWMPNNISHGVNMLQDHIEFALGLKKKMEQSLTV